MEPPSASNTAAPTFKEAMAGQKVRVCRLIAKKSDLCRVPVRLSSQLAGFAFVFHALHSR